MNYRKSVSRVLYILQRRIGQIIQFAGLNPKSGFFYSCHLSWVSGHLGKDHTDYWEKFGNVYLDQKNNSEYESERDENFRKTLVDILKSRNTSDKKLVVELGGGYFQNLVYLDGIGLDLDLYNIDIAPIRDEIIPASPNIHFIQAAIEESIKYSHLLKKADLVFTFGLWMYMNEATIINSLQNIVSRTPYETDFVFAEPCNDKEAGVVYATLEKSHRRKGGTFIHNYESILKICDLEIVSEHISSLPNSNLVIIHSRKQSTEPASEGL